MGEEAFDAVIAGGGIGGTTLALALAREGWRVAVVEKEREGPRAFTRPEGLWPATLRALDALGVGGLVRRDLARAVQRVDVRLAGTRARVFSLTDADFLTAGTRVHFTDPAGTRRVLLDAAEATGVVTRFTGTTVTGLDRVNGRVTGVHAERDGQRVTLRAPLTVGDDGAGSVTRRAAGLRLHATPFPAEFILAVVPRPPGWPVADARVTLRPAGFRDGVPAALVVPVPPDRVGVLFPARPGTFGAFHAAADPVHAFRRAVTRVLPDAPTLLHARAFPHDFVRVVRPVGHVDAYHTPGLALVGDAAHPVSPVGGQGANMAVADALALARHVTAAVKPGARVPSRALRAFERERRPANARSVRLSEHAGAGLRALWHRPALAPALVAGLRALDHAPATKARLVRNAGHAFEDATLAQRSLAMPA